MNRLSTEKRVEIIKLLSEGMSCRSVSRVTGRHLVTILKVLNETGERCRELLDRTMRNVDVAELQIDEQWTYAFAKDAHVREDHPDDAGSWFIYSAIDPCSKAVICHRVGRRTEETTYDFIADLATRFEGRVHLSSDAYGAYRGAVAESLAGRVDYGTMQKTFKSAPNPSDPARYCPATCVAVQWHQVMGEPDPRKLCTSHIERYHATLRTYCKRLNRLTLAFSKKASNLANAIALLVADYNFVKFNRGVGMTPAMALGVASSPWTVAQLVA